MIRGRFSPSHLGTTEPAATEVPLLNVFLYLPAIDAHTSVDFLVDTGADVTVVHPRDSLRLAMTPAQWELIRRQPAERLSGAGAGCHTTESRPSWFFRTKTARSR